MNIEDKIAIHELLIRYATGIDARQWTLFRSCFTGDFKGDWGRFGSWDGGDAVTKAMEDGHMGVGKTMHRMANIAITPVDGGAHTRTYVDALMMPIEAGGVVHQAEGYYDDELVKIDGQWKIRRRVWTGLRFRADGVEQPLDVSAPIDG